MQSAAEMHQLQAHHGGDAAGLPILVPTLAAQMLNKKYGIELLHCTFRLICCNVDNTFKPVLCIAAAVVQKLLFSQVSAS